MYGCEDENIIKLGFPKWDKFKDDKIKNNNISIFLMLTWRQMNQGKNISDYYLNNTLKLLTNKKLNTILEKKNITLFFTFHHELKRLKGFNLKNKTKILENFKNIKEVNYSLISECIFKSSLFISDFSSVIFEFMYQKKPFVLFIPDSEDPMIKEIYIEPYYDIINGLKNDSIVFVNKYFNLSKAIKKIIYYINHNFHIEQKVERFYKSFKSKIFGSY